MSKKRDWKNPQDYEFVKSLTGNQLAWEFLRRNPEYRKDWKKELPLYLEREQKYRNDPKHKRDPVYGKPIMSIDHPQFEVNPFKWDHLYKWGLYCLKNPDQDNPFPLHFDRTYGDIQTGHGKKPLTGPTAIIKEKTAFFPLPKGKASVIFDLELLLTQQFDKALKDLVEKQKFLEDIGEIKVNKPRVRPDLDDFICYLRMLDAKIEGAKTREIADIIYTNIENKHPAYMANRMVRDTLRTARRFMEKDYRKIVIHYIQLMEAVSTLA